MITICLVYFRSLKLAHLAAALFSLRQQSFSLVDSIVLLDNNTDDDEEHIHALVSSLEFPIPVRILSVKHGDPHKAHSWSTNEAVQQVITPFVLFTRADYLLDFDAVQDFTNVMTPENFVVGGYFDVPLDVGEIEKTKWRVKGPQILPGREWDHVEIDAGVWACSKETFDKIGGLDERLSAWGHAQTHFQYKLHSAGVPFVNIQKVLFYHMKHAVPEIDKDHKLALEQLKQVGVTLKQMWARYTGPNHPYKDKDE